MKAKIITTLGLVILLALAGNANAQTGSAITDSFSCIQVYQTWIVPDNIHSIRVEAAGAGTVFSEGDGGEGGIVKTTLVVTPGETLYLNIGGVPYNGGGDQGLWYNNDWTGTAGGGLTSLGRTGNRLTDTLIVAGGAGGNLIYDLYSGSYDFLGFQPGGNGGEISQTPNPYLYTTGSFMQGGEALSGGGGGGGYIGGGGGERSPGDGGTSYVTPVGTSNTVYQTGGNHQWGGYLKITYYTQAEIPAVAGTISGQATVCSGTNSTMLILTGYTGTIQWQSSTDNVTFDNIHEATGATYTASNLTATTWYRAVVSSGGTSATTASVANMVISGIDASASSNPVALGSAAILSATISPAISGVTVSFNVDPGTGVITTYTAVTNSSGIATTAPISGLSVNLYKVVATAASGCATSEPAYVAVYDPNSSFITGGGWITSSAGALVAQPLLSGKANFGFIAKYQKGKSQVDGNTEFQFQDGNFNFKSSELDAGTLVISGSKGTYRGEGSVNGAGDYGFMVTAVDGSINGSGGTDLFRIKIWDKSQGNTVVYDNNMGKDENSVPTTVLGGGSIVIHYAKATNSIMMNTATIVENAELAWTGKLTVTVMPNPTSYYFTIGLKSLSKEKITVTMTDITGRVIEQRTGIPANSRIQLAGHYHPGVYIATFLQGNDKVTIQLMKEGK